MDIQKETKGKGVVRYKVGDIVWVNFESLKGSYVGPAKITYADFDVHYWVRIPIMMSGENEFLIDERKVEQLITDGEENVEKEERTIKREETPKNA